MIRFLRGTYLCYEAGSVIIETSGGIGFRVYVAETSGLLAMSEGTELELYTYMQVKEDGMSLFGFATTEELSLFEQLITVKGVGPKAGLAIMSLGTPNQIKLAIASSDAGTISHAQGVGKKTAERIILELKDKVSVIPEAMLGGTRIEAGDLATQLPYSSEREEAVIALTTLGYTKKEAEQAVAQVAAAAESGEAGSIDASKMTAEEYVRKSLKYLL